MFFKMESKQCEICGKVIEGIDIIENISKVQRDRNDKTLKDVKINKVTILEK